ncbi:MAG: hypothetical protein ACFFCS_29815 [Candidatus Hodarchaeota archaeon]
MDWQELPDLNLTDEQRRRNEEEVTKFVEEHDRNVARRISALRKAGYSDDEIENLFAF